MTTFGKTIDLFLVSSSYYPVANIGNNVLKSSLPDKRVLLCNYIYFFQEQSQIKTRETPSCTPEMGYAAAVHTHIANIAGRVGESLLEWDDENHRFTNSEEANQYITPEYRAPWTLPVA